MPTKLIPLPKPSGSIEAPLLSKRRDTVVFLIGGRRYAFDFVTTVRELRSEPAKSSRLGLAGDRRGGDRRRDPQGAVRVRGHDHERDTEDRGAGLVPSNPTELNTAPTMKYRMEVLLQTMKTKF